MKSNDVILVLGSQGDHGLVEEINNLTHSNGVILNNLRMWQFSALVRIWSNIIISNKEGLR